MVKVRKQEPKAVPVKPKSLNKLMKPTKLSSKPTEVTVTNILQGISVQNDCQDQSRTLKSKTFIKLKKNNKAHIKELLPSIENGVVQDSKLRQQIVIKPKHMSSNNADASFQPLKNKQKKKLKSVESYSKSNSAVHFSASKSIVVDNETKLNSVIEQQNFLINNESDHTKHLMKISKHLNVKHPALNSEVNMPKSLKKGKKIKNKSVESYQLSKPSGNSSEEECMFQTNLKNTKKVNKSEKRIKPDSIEKPAQTFDNVGHVAKPKLSLVNSKVVKNKINHKNIDKILKSGKHTQSHVTEKAAQTLENVEHFVEPKRTLVRSKVMINKSNPKVIDKIPKSRKQTQFNVTDAPTATCKDDKHLLRPSEIILVSSKVSGTKKRKIPVKYISSDSDSSVNNSPVSKKVKKDILPNKSNLNIGAVATKKSKVTPLIGSLLKSRNIVVEPKGTVDAHCDSFPPFVAGKNLKLKKNALKVKKKKGVENDLPKVPSSSESDMQSVQEIISHKLKKNKKAKLAPITNLGATCSRARTILCKATSISERILELQSDDSSLPTENESNFESLDHPSSDNAAKSSNEDEVNSSDVSSFKLTADDSCGPASSVEESIAVSSYEDMSTNESPSYQPQTDEPNVMEELCNAQTMDTTELVNIMSSKPFDQQKFAKMVVDLTDSKTVSCRYIKKNLFNI